MLKSYIPRAQVRSKTLTTFLLIVLVNFIGLSLAVPFFSFTNATCCAAQKAKYTELLRSFAIWTIVVVMFVPYALWLFRYGLSDESTLGLTIISAVMSPIGIMGGIIYPFWLIHLLQHRADNI